MVLHVNVFIFVLKLGGIAIIFLKSFYIIKAITVF
jgi:hypothetical protein